MRRGIPATLGVAALLAVMIVGRGNALAEPSGEFLNPSPNAPPAASTYNSAAPTICPVTMSVPFCELDAPSSTLPPPDADNPETYLNSAYWPAEERPDIEMYAIQQYGYSYQNCSDPSTWNHYCFLVDAEAVGYPVTHTPQVGDLILARCADFTFVNGAKYTCGPPYGNIYYIGYVEQVLSDGSFIYTGGGTGPGDSGLEFQWLSGSMDPSADFIGFFPTGQSPSIKVTVEVDYGGGGGAGTVSDSNGQTCSSGGEAAVCTFTERVGVPVTFTETPQSGSTFWAWYGACSGSRSCGASFDGTNSWLTADFLPASQSGSGGGTSPGGSGGGPSTGGSGADTGPKSGTSGTSHATKSPGIRRVTTARGVIHAALRGSDLTCKLTRWTGRRWAKPRVQRCGGSVTFRNLAAGRYRLTVASGKASAIKMVTLRHGATTRAGDGHAKASGVNKPPGAGAGKIQAQSAKS
jgi:hypothetical protein